MGLKREQSRSGKIGQVDKWKGLGTIGGMTPRRYDDERTQKEIHVRVHGKVALAALRSEKTLAQLAEQFEAQANQISQWRQQTIDKYGWSIRQGTPTRAASSPVTISPTCLRNTLHQHGWQWALGCQRLCGTTVAFGQV